MTSEKIGHDLVMFTELRGLKPYPKAGHRFHKGSWVCRELHADVMKYPAYAKNDTLDTDWHIDGMESSLRARPITDCWLVLWASNRHTEFKVQDLVISPRDNDVILVPNQLHRRPTEFEGVRWTFRQRVFKLP